MDNMLYVLPTAIHFQWIAFILSIVTFSISSFYDVTAFILIIKLIAKCLQHLLLFEQWACGGKNEKIQKRWKRRLFHFVFIFQALILYPLLLCVCDVSCQNFRFIIVFHFGAFRFFFYFTKSSLSVFFATNLTFHSNSTEYKSQQKINKNKNKRKEWKSRYSSFSLPDFLLFSSLLFDSVFPIFNFDFFICFSSLFFSTFVLLLFYCFLTNSTTTHTHTSNEK